MKKFLIKHFKVLFISFLIIGAVISRFLPHPANFTPIAAIALFAGFYIKNKLVWLIPITAMIISDIFIGLYDPKIMIAVYISFALIGLLGYFNRNQRDFSTIFSGSLLGSLLFFIISNLAVWRFSGIYPLTTEGLINCYYLALPFFRNTIAGDLFYTGLLFGSWALVENYLLTKLNRSNSEV